jgi:chromosome segregation ATPase
MTRNLLAALALALALAWTGNAQEQSLAEAAKKAREQKKQAPKTVKVFTNDNIQAGEVSAAGGAPPAPTKEAAAGEKKTAEGAPGEKGEAYWRGRFSNLRTKLSQAQKELDILQRELNVAENQYYDDPNKALREKVLRTDINDHLKKIQDKKDEIHKLKQQLSDLEDELRRTGGDPGWARE